MALTDSQASKIKTLMLARTQPAYFLMDREMKLKEWSGNISDYGYENIVKDVECDEIFDFLVGYKAGEELDLPIVTSPNGTQCSISALPEDDQIYVLLMDASKDFDQQFLLQQKANEASLLNVKQRKLMAQLIATQKELEQKNNELEDAYSLQRRFLSGVSHEFRTPLASIIGYVNALLEKSESSTRENNSLSEYCFDKLRVIENNSSYLLSLVENLLDHGKFSEQEMTFNPQRVEIGVFFSSLHEMLFPIAERKGLELLLTFGAMGDYVIDETRVRQCVINLVNNAIKFTESGLVELSINHKDDELLIKVKDTGIGMSDDEVENIYEAFWQSTEHEQTGAGLGMTITRRIVESMAGEIEISSKLGEGTTVQLSFPAYEQELEVVDEGLSQSAPVDVASLNVLLVEDDENISELVQFYLENWGYQTNVCFDGQSALDWLASNTVDIIFLDLNMPVLNGIQTLEGIRDRGIETPIYIMSAQAMGNDDELDDVIKKMATGHILKPVNFRELQSLLAQHN